jgi:hypothetical protein
LELLISAAIGVVVLVMAARPFVKHRQSLSSAELKDDFEALTHEIRATIDCKTTMSLINAACPAAGVAARVDLFNKSNFIPKTGAKIGNFTLKALCTSSGVIDENKLSIQASRLKPGFALSSVATADFYNDPATGKPMTWKSLFPAGELCSRPCTKPGFTSGSWSLPDPPEGINTQQGPLIISTAPCRAVKIMAGNGVARSYLGPGPYGGCSFNSALDPAQPYSAWIYASNFYGSGAYPPGCVINYVVWYEP